MVPKSSHAALYYFYNALLEYADCLVGQTLPEQTAKESLEKAASIYQRALAGEALLSTEGLIASWELDLRRQRCEELKGEFTTQVKQSDVVIVAQLLLQELRTATNIDKAIKQEQARAKSGERNLSIPEALVLRPHERLQTRQAELHAVKIVIDLLKGLYKATEVSHLQVVSSLPCCPSS